MLSQAKEIKQKVVDKDAEGKDVVINYLVYTPDTNVNDLKEYRASTWSIRFR